MNYSKIHQLLLFFLCLSIGTIFIVQKDFLRSYIPIITSFNQLSNQTVQHGLIIPTFVHFDHIKIFDIVIHRHSNDSQMFSIFFSVYRYSWPWSEIVCFFHYSNTSVTGIINRRSAEAFILCPLPDIERKLVLNNRSQLSLSVRINDSTLPKTYFVSPIISVPIYPKNEYNISIYTMLRDKIHELVEWIEYHLLIGIEHFYLYDHFSSDNLTSYLRPYMERNLVTIVRWPYKPLKGQHWNLIQCASMNHALKNFGPYNRWMGYFDVDEYFIIKNTTNLIPGNIALARLLDEAFPESKYPGGVQFEKCQIACFLTQTDVIVSRYHILLEKCRHVEIRKDCSKPPKLFIRPRNVPLLYSIHTLNYGMTYANSRASSSFGRFQHFHQGMVTSNPFQEKTVDRSLDIFIKDLKKRIIKY